MIENEQNKRIFSDVITKAFQEVMGDEESARYEILLNRSDQIGRGAEEISFMKQFLSENFGSAEAEGLAVCIGKNSYSFIKNQFEKSLKFRAAEFRLLPTQRRVRNALEELRSIVLDPLGIQFTCLEGDDEIVWRLQCAYAAEECPAYFVSGVLQEMLTDVSGGRFFPIAVNLCEETQRTQIVIAKKALGH